MSSSPRLLSDREGGGGDGGLIGIAPSSGAVAPHLPQRGGYDVGGGGGPLSGPAPSEAGSSTASRMAGSFRAAGDAASASSSSSSEQFTPAVRLVAGFVPDGVARWPEGWDDARSVFGVFASHKCVAAQPATPGADERPPLPVSAVSAIAQPAPSEPESQDEWHHPEAEFLRFIALHGPQGTPLAAVTLFLSVGMLLQQLFADESAAALDVYAAAMSASLQLIAAVVVAVGEFWMRPPHLTTESSTRHQQMETQSSCPSGGVADEADPPPPPAEEDASNRHDAEQHYAVVVQRCRLLGAVVYIPSAALLGWLLAKQPQYSLTPLAMFLGVVYVIFCGLPFSTLAAVFPCALVFFDAGVLLRTWDDWNTWQKVCFALVQLAMPLQIVFITRHLDTRTRDRFAAVCNAHRARIRFRDHEALARRILHAVAPRALLPNISGDAAGALFGQEGFPEGIVGIVSVPTLSGWASSMVPMDAVRAINAIFARFDGLLIWYEKRCGIRRAAVCGDRYIFMHPGGERFFVDDERRSAAAAAGSASAMVTSLSPPPRRGSASTSRVGSRRGSGAVTASMSIAGAPPPPPLSSSSASSWYDAESSTGPYKAFIALAHDLVAVAEEVRRIRDADLAHRQRTVPQSPQASMAAGTRASSVGFDRSGIVGVDGAGTGVGFDLAFSVAVGTGPCYAGLHGTGRHLRYVVQGPGVTDARRAHAAADPTTSSVIVSRNAILDMLRRRSDDDDDFGGDADGVDEDDDDDDAGIPPLALMSSAVEQSSGPSTALAPRDGAAAQVDDAAPAEPVVVVLPPYASVVTPPPPPVLVSPTGRPDLTTPTSRAFGGVVVTDDGEALRTDADDDEDDDGGAARGDLPSPITAPLSGGRTLAPPPVPGDIAPADLQRASAGVLPSAYSLVPVHANGNGRRAVAFRVVSRPFDAALGPGDASAAGSFSHPRTMRRADGVSPSANSLSRSSFAGGDGGETSTPSQSTSAKANNSTNALMLSPLRVPPAAAAAGSSASLRPQSGAQRHTTPSPAPGGSSGAGGGFFTPRSIGTPQQPPPSTESFLPLFGAAVLLPPFGAGGESVRGGRSSTGDLEALDAGRGNRRPGSGDNDEDVDSADAVKASMARFVADALGGAAAAAGVRKTVWGTFEDHVVEAAFCVAAAQNGWRIVLHTTLATNVGSLMAVVVAAVVYPRLAARDRDSGEVLDADADESSRRTLLVVSAVFFALSLVMLFGIRWASKLHDERAAEAAAAADAVLPTNDDVDEEEAAAAAEETTTTRTTTDRPNDGGHRQRAAKLARLTLGLGTVDAAATTLEAHGPHGAAQGIETTSLAALCTFGMIACAVGGNGSVIGTAALGLLQHFCMTVLLAARWQPLPLKAALIVFAVLFPGLITFALGPRTAIGPMQAPAVAMPVAVFVAIGDLAIAWYVCRLARHDFDIERLSAVIREASALRLALTRRLTRGLVPDHLLSLVVARFDRHHRELATTTTTTTDGVGARPPSSAAPPSLATLRRPLAFSNHKAPGSFWQRCNLQPHPELTSSYGELCCVVVDFVSPWRATPSKSKKDSANPANPANPATAAATAAENPRQSPLVAIVDCDESSTAGGRTPTATKADGPNCAMRSPLVSGGASMMCFSTTDDRGAVAVPLPRQVEHDEQQVVAVKGPGQEQEEEAPPAAFLTLQGPVIPPAVEIALSTLDGVDAAIASVPEAYLRITSVFGDTVVIAGPIGEPPAPAPTAAPAAQPQVELSAAAVAVAKPLTKEERTRQVLQELNPRTDAEVAKKAARCARERHVMAAARGCIAVLRQLTAVVAKGESNRFIAGMTVDSAIGSVIGSVTTSMRYSLFGVAPRNAQHLLDASPVSAAAGLPHCVAFATESFRRMHDRQRLADATGALFVDLFRSRRRRSGSGSGSSTGQQVEEATVDATLDTTAFDRPVWWRSRSLGQCRVFPVKLGATTSTGSRPQGQPLESQQV